MSDNVYLRYYYKQPLDGSLQTESTCLVDEEKSQHEQITIFSVPFDNDLKKMVIRDEGWTQLIFQLD